MTKRKILMLALSLCMVAILAVGGTLAYFTDDEQATNVFTIGNVEINIDELAYVDGQFEVFEDENFTMYPIDNEQGSYLYNKIVYTANTSDVNAKDPTSGYAYIRNIVLIEANTKLGYTREDGACCFPGIHTAYDTNAYDEGVNYYVGSDGKHYHVASQPTSLKNTVTINNVEYWVLSFTEINGDPIEPDAALATLHSVWMDEDVTQDEAKGWGDDGKVDIIVYSQAIQATGLEHDAAMAELGEVNETNLQTWLAAAEQAEINDWTSKGQAE